MFSLENVNNFCKKTLHFGLFIPLSGIFLTYGGNWIPKKILVWLSNCRNKKIRQTILKNVEKNFSYDETFKCLKSEELPIWYYWMQGEEHMPLIPKMCLASIRKHANGHPVKVITEKNCRDYVQLPDFIWKLYINGEIKQAHFADIYRVSLLAKHGGLWLDATIYLNKDIDENIFKTSFFSIKTKPHGLFVSQCRWAVYCLGCNKGNILLSNVRDMFYSYLSKQSVFVDYFMFDQFISILYDEVTQIRDMIEDVPYNNKNVEKLSALLCAPFDIDIYASLCHDTDMFKLSWKLFSSEQLLQNENNFYNYLLSKTL